MLVFEGNEDFVGPPHDSGRQPGEFRHMNSVRPVGATRLEAMEEDHGVPGFPDGNVPVSGMLQPLG